MMRSLDRSLGLVASAAALVECAMSTMIPPQPSAPPPAKKRDSGKKRRYWHPKERKLSGVKGLR